MATQTTLKDVGPKWLEHLEAAGKHERTVATYQPVEKRQKVVAFKAIL
jgi:hypothetical protein